MLFQNLRRQLKRRSFRQSKEALRWFDRLS
jgi:hypothetical protein